MSQLLGPTLAGPARLIKQGEVQLLRPNPDPSHLLKILPADKVSRGFPLQARPDPFALPIPIASRIVKVLPADVVSQGFPLQARQSLATLLPLPGTGISKILKITPADLVSKGLLQGTLQPLGSSQPTKPSGLMTIAVPSTPVTSSSYDFWHYYSP